MTKKIKTIVDLRDELTETRKLKKKISLVPTMGNIHEGHLSLVKASKRKCKHTVVSIFVNPKQFAPNEDFNNYPRTIDSDIELISKLNVNLVFIPEAIELYPINNKISMAN